MMDSGRCSSEIIAYFATGPSFGDDGDPGWGVMIAYPLQDGERLLFIVRSDLEVPGDSSADDRGVGAE
jgi:hypothetical protein